VKNVVVRWRRKEHDYILYKDSRGFSETRTCHQYASSCICIMSSSGDNFSRGRLIILESIYDKIGWRLRLGSWVASLILSSPFVGNKTLRDFILFLTGKARGHHIYLWWEIRGFSRLWITCNLIVEGLMDVRIFFLLNLKREKNCKRYKYKNRTYDKYLK